MIQSFFTVKNQAMYELIEKKSKFIAYIKPVATEELAVSFINEVKAKHWNAKHNVYAYVLMQNNISRYSDDGEPHGTAGLPILDVLKKNSLQNVVVVVTRYFGGVLLGTGGLVRAYSGAVTGVLNSVGIIKMSVCCKCNLLCDYSLYGKISNLIAACGGHIDDISFAREIKICFHVKKENFPLLSKKICELSSGSLGINSVEEDFFQD